MIGNLMTAALRTTFFSSVLVVCVEKELLAPTVCENFQTIGEPYYYTIWTN